MSDFRLPFPDPDAPPPDPNLHQLIAQFGASAHKLRFALLVSRRPLEREDVRNIASGAIAGTEALHRVVPGEAVGQVEQVLRLLTEVAERLET